MITPYKHENTLFKLALGISLLLWLLLVIGTFGFVLLYGLFGFLVYLFAQSAFISHLKGSGVRITPGQYPDLHRQLIACCQKIDLQEVPEMYLLRTDFFNALATRFLGRNFIVLFSEVVDSLETRPAAVNFYIGHELGHLHRKHLQWQWLLWPASILPLLGAALRRAQEYTCDRYGVACCAAGEDIKAAIAAIAAGNSRWKTLNTDAYLQQISESSGFWMSFNELTNDYPWLSKRMASALALSRGEEITHPSRHWGAKLLALVVPRFGVGGSGSVLVTIAMIGILAAVALPAYQDYMKRADVTAALVDAVPVRTALVDFYNENLDWPTPVLSEIGYANDDPLQAVSGKYTIDIFEDGVIGIDVSVLFGGSGQFVILTPTVGSGEIEWKCTSQNIEANYLPSNCR